MTTRAQPIPTWSGREAPRGRAAIAASAALLMAACITESPRPAVDTALPDTTAPDTEPPFDTGAHDAIGEPDTRPDTEPPPDGTTSDGTTPDGTTPDVSPPACSRDSACEVSPPSMCHAWRCEDGACVERPVSDAACSDDDACTLDDFCLEGVCTPGWVLSCEALSPDCFEAAGDVCAPESGCPGVAAPEGQTCDDGLGPAGGACVRGWVVPSDECDGRGFCVDRSDAVPSGAHPLTGRWFLNLASTPLGAAPHTLVTNLLMGPDGGFEVAGVGSTDPSWEQLANIAVNGGRGTYCESTGSVVALTLGDLTYNGVVDLTHALMVLSSDDGTDTAGLALRADGDRNDLDGEYHVIVTERPAGTSIGYMTSVGFVSFDNGCIDTPGRLVSEPLQGAELSFVANGLQCFEQVEHDRWRLVSTLQDASGSSHAFSWLGAIGPMGDVVLLAHEGAGLGFGTVVLVRGRDALGRSAMTGTWAFVSQRGGLTSVEASVAPSIMEYGWLSLGDTFTAMEGEILSRVATFEGHWWYTGPKGRYSQRVSIDGVPIGHTGVVSPALGLLVAWVARPPELPEATPQILMPGPAEGSLMFAIGWWDR